MPHLVARQLAFRNFPALAGDAASRYGKHVGLLGEYLVAARLMSWGYGAALVGDNHPYDIITEVGHHNVRIQVKSRLAGGGDVWNFSLTHNGGQGAAGAGRYAPGDFDLAALVIVPFGHIVFTRSRGKEIQVRLPAGRILDADHERNQFEAHLREIGALTREQYYALRGAGASAAGNKPRPDADLFGYQPEAQAVPVPPQPGEDRAIARTAAFQRTGTAPTSLHVMRPATVISGTTRMEHESKSSR